MKNGLPDEDPREGDLRHHPVHGQGWIDEDDHRNVNNYRHPFIRAQNAPPHVWPINARDWGLEEWLPSQTDMTPDGGGWTHPALVMDDEDEKVGQDHAIVNAAFYYRSVLGQLRVLILADDTGYQDLPDAARVDHVDSPTGQSIRIPRRPPWTLVGAVEEWDDIVP
jgi:hypothetical protein